MPRASLVNIVIDVRMGPFRHQFVVPTTPARVTEFQWFSLMKTIKDGIIRVIDSPTAEPTP